MATWKVYVTRIVTSNCAIWQNKLDIQNTALDNGGNNLFTTFNFGYLDIVAAWACVSSRGLCELITNLVEKIKINISYSEIVHDAENIWVFFVNDFQNI